MHHKTKIALFIAILFHLSGFIGMMTASRPWFISMTPVTLGLMGVLLWWTDEKFDKYYLNAAIVFTTGMVVEIIGVNTGLLFGHYTYGGVMGLKTMGVPLLMGIQWWVTVVCSAHLLYFVLNKTLLHIKTLTFALLAAAITTGYDVLIEPIAMDFGYWHWVGDTVPLYNYVCWFFISFGLHWIFLTFNKPMKVNYYAVSLMLIQSLFFLLLNLCL